MKPLDDRRKHVGESAPSSRGALFALIAGGTFVGGSGAMLVASLLEPGPPSGVAENPAAIEAADPRLADALLQLARELRESRAAGASLPAPPLDASQRNIATESGESVLAELSAAVRELRDALRSAGAGAFAANPPALSPPSHGRRLYLPALPPELAESDMLYEKDAAYTRQHLLWSEQQILDSYGTPDGISIEASGRAVWKYEDSEGAGERSFYVIFFQGRVVGVGSGG